MSKSSKNYYSVAVNHPDLPGAYLGSFGIPGRPPEWVMEGRSQKIFVRPEDAENAGFKMMMGYLNTPVKNDTRIRVSSPDKRIISVSSHTERKNDADKVFSNFKTLKPRT